MFKNGWRSFNDSKRICEQNKARLVQLRSKAELDFIDANVTQSGFWIDSKPTANRVPTEFSDGSTIEWIDWYPGYDNGSQTFDCTAFGISNHRPSAMETRKWYTERCTGTRMVVCEKLNKIYDVDQRIRHFIQRQQEIVAMKDMVYVDQLRHDIDERIMNITRLIEKTNRNGTEVADLENDTTNEVSFS